MNDRMLVYKLMYQAFLDIRWASSEEKSYKAIFKVAYLFHNVPLQIERVERGEGNFLEILANLNAQAKRIGCESWLNNAIRNFRNQQAPLGNSTVGGGPE